MVQAVFSGPNGHEPHNTMPHDPAPLHGEQVNESSLTKMEENKASHNKLRPDDNSDSGPSNNEW